MEKFAQTWNWMLNLSGDLLISEVNIPGSHDCAAISESRGTWHRHDNSISNQLARGIRLLDVRIAIKKEYYENEFRVGSDGILARDGERAAGFFVEFPPGCYIHLQLPTTETFGDLKYSLQQLTNISYGNQILRDVEGSDVVDTDKIAELWPATSTLVIYRLSSRLADESVHMPSWCHKLKYDFLTTHGSGHLYQSLVSLLDECKTFLEQQPSESLIINFQVDDGDKSDPIALHILKGIINADRYPLYLLCENSNGSDPPTLGELRGKMFVMNRINDDYSFGQPLPVWVNQQNCEWIVGNNEIADGFRVFVQDKFTGFGSDRDTVERLKSDLVIQSVVRYNDMIKERNEQSLDGIINDGVLPRCRDVLMNYASVSSSSDVFNTKPRLMKHFLGCHDKLTMAVDGAKLPRNRIGWMLFDYPFDTLIDPSDISGGGTSDERIIATSNETNTSTSFTIVDMIISSNYGFSIM